MVSMYTPPPSSQAVTKVVAGAGASPRIRALADHRAPGTDDKNTLQAAFDALTSGRTWIEWVKVIGKLDFVTGSSANMDNYTGICLCEGSIVRASDGSSAILRNSNRNSTGNNDIRVCGGLFDGGKTGSSTFVANARAMLFVRVTNLHIHDVEVKNFRSDGIRIEGTESGGSGNTRPYYLDHIYTHDNLQYGMRVMRSARAVFASHIYSQDNLVDGLSIDHSEGQYTHIYCHDNDGYGIRTHNGHSLVFDNINCSENGQHGFVIRGVVDSNMANIHCKDNSQSTTDGADLNTGFKWTLSASGTTEYYLELSGGGDPSVKKPFNIDDDGTELTRDTIGALAAGGWNHGDNDSLGYDTIYARLSDGSDPDSSTMTAVGWADMFFSNDAGESYGVTKELVGGPIYAGPRSTTKVSHTIYFEGNAAANTEDLDKSTADPNANIVLGPVFTAGGVTGEIRAPDALNSLRIQHAARDGSGIIMYGRENSGVATILSTTTAIVINHGLLITPSAKDFSIVATEDPTNDPGHIWISTITSTQFTINCAADPGSSNLDFSWAVRAT